MPRPNSSSGRPIPNSGNPFLARIRRSFGTKVVTIIHAEGTVDEASFEAEGHIQPKMGMFAVDTPIYKGDVAVIPDPRGGNERRLAAEVNVHDVPNEDLAHTQVVWGRAPAARVAPVRRLTFENLHPEIQGSAGSLFADGHFESAIAEAFKSIEVRVRAITSSSKSGASLMGDAFRADGTVLDVAGHKGRSGEDEREGFLHIFRGAMIGVRNPGAHELLQPGDPQQALEYLGFASLLHRRIDAAVAKAE